MRKTEFFEAMADIMGTLGEVKQETITKPGEQYTGLCVRPKQSDGPIVMPVINLDRLYAEYSDGMSFDDCVAKAKEILEARPPVNSPSVEMEKLLEWETAKDTLFLRLCGDVTEGIYRDIADMQLVPYMQVSDDGTMAARVTEPLVEKWGVSRDELFEQAKRNQETIRPAKIDKLNEMLGIPDGMGPTILVITTQTAVCGASAILYENMANTIRDMLGEDFYVLPSSIHEVLVLPKSFTDETEKLKAMVRTVNGTSVDVRERLTNSVYTFDDNELIQVA